MSNSSSISYSNSFPASATEVTQIARMGFAYLGKLLQFTQVSSTRIMYYKIPHRQPLLQPLMIHHMLLFEPEQNKKKERNFEP